MIPSSTYRLQLHKGFTFDDAAAIADYLKALGVSHVYCSPYLQAAPGSMHGYDVVDHRHVNQELGGSEAHERFCKRLGEAGLGQILDIVPNHMSLAEQNSYWQDVLENGPGSRYAEFFDVDWNSPEERLRDKVLVPVLGDQYGRVLKDRGIQLKREGSTFHVEASGQSLPVAPQSLCGLLEHAAGEAHNDTLRFLAASFGRLPTPDFTNRRAVLARDRDKAVLSTLLERLCREEGATCEAIDRRVEEVNSDPDLLDEFLNQQHYRLSYWKSADQQLGYRRFFDVNTLIGLRTEREMVFDETHALILGWLREGVLDGVRVDHPDGLRDPLQYFERLRAKAPSAYIVGEKILARGELLREAWPIEGTSGYDFLNMVNGVLVSPEGLRRLSEHYHDFTGGSVDFPEVAHAKKLAVTQEALASDVNRLTELFIKICESNREQRDFTRAEVRRALREVVSCFGIYRTYVVPQRDEIVMTDREVIERAVGDAKRYRTDIDGALFEFMRDVLTLRVRGTTESEFVERFQQFTSPVMAKGVEDTAFYTYNRLISLNEVGGDPGYDGVEPEALHQYLHAMQQTHPASMVTLSTHDTKRADDVRARLAVLTEVPDEFMALVSRWSEQFADLRGPVWPDRGTEWFLYQSAIGAWPISADRLKQYMDKAMREAKEQTSWVSNNQEYEEALHNYIDALLGSDKFVAQIEEFVARLQPAGRRNSLTQSLIKNTAPGMPDLYQGGELWDHSLVDPDNRRPVDYAERRRLLAHVEVMEPAAMLQRMEDGLPKLWVLHRSLLLRQERPECFDAQAAYTPLAASGEEAHRILAFLRGGDVAVVTARLVHELSHWADTEIELPAGQWSNQLTHKTHPGGRTRIADLLEAFPVALLVRDKEEVRKSA